MQALAPREVFKSQKAIAMRFLNASVLERKALNRNLSWGFPLGNLLPKTRVLKHRVLERKRRPNANASVLGTQRFRTLRVKQRTAGLFQGRVPVCPRKGSPVCPREGFCLSQTPSRPKCLCFINTLFLQIGGFYEFTFLRDGPYFFKVNALYAS